MKISNLSFDIRRDRDNRFIDIIVDNKSMYDLLNIDGSGMTTILSTHFTHTDVNEFSGYFEGKFIDPELKTGITPFYVCGECGDYGCGVLGWKVEVTGEIIKWSDFHWDDNLDPEEYGSDVPNIPDLIFSSNQYMNIIKDMPNLYEKMIGQYES